MNRKQRRAHKLSAFSRVMDEAKAAGGAIGNGALRTKLVRTHLRYLWPADEETLWKVAEVDLAKNI